MAGRWRSLFAGLITWRVLVLCAALCAFEPAAAATGRVYEIDLPAQNVADALTRLSEQTGVSMVFSYDLIRDRTARPVRGSYTIQQALDALLAGTGLSGGLSDKGVLMISRARAGTQTGGEASVTQNENRKDSQTPARRTRVAAFFASLAAAFSAVAQDAGGGATDAEAKVEEVTVTARKRTERLQDVPSSIAVASEKDLLDRNIISMTKLDSVAPGLTFATNPSRFGSGPAIALRGITTQTQSAGVQDSVGIVIDGIVISRAKAGAFPDLGDVQRIEVLRGPQGTLFGKNASAGVINVVTKDPTSDFESELSVDYSTYHNTQARGAVSGPIVEDRLFGRISAFAKSRDGYIDNLHDGTDWETDQQQGVRGKLLYTPTDRDAIKLSGDVVVERNDGGAAIARQVRPNTPQYVLDGIGALIGLENDKIDVNSVGRNRHQTGGLAAQWDRSMGDLSLTSISAYRMFNQDFIAGTYSYFTPFDSGYSTGYTHLRQYSQEIRIASSTERAFDYVAGLYAMNDEVRTRITNQASFPNFVTGATTQRDYISDVETLNYAGFGEMNFKLGPHFKLTAGARWTHEKVDLRIDGYPAAGTTRLGHPVGTTIDSTSADNFSWRAGAQWNIDADRMLYATVSTGYKGPGFNVNTSAIGDSQPVDPETATSYEVGLRSEFFDRRVTSNLTVYRTYFKDFQTQAGGSIPGQILARSILLNAGEMRTQGVEAELHARPTNETEITFNAAYIDAEYTDFTNAPCYTAQPAGPTGCRSSNTQNLNGFPLPNTPKWSAGAFLKQGFQVPMTGWRGFFTLDYTWRDKVQWNASEDPLAIEDAYGLLGASLGLNSDSDRASIKIYGINLTNQFHTAGIVAGNPVTHLIPPDYARILGAQATFRF